MGGLAGPAQPGSPTKLTALASTAMAKRVFVSMMKYSEDSVSFSFLRGTLMSVYQFRITFASETVSS